MTAVGGVFYYIVNMDSNVDLIGTLDQYQDFSFSNPYFLFDDTKYYSSKRNDLTQVIFTDHIYKQTEENNPIEYKSVRRKIAQ